jgi:hypothetical protein
MFRVCSRLKIKMTETKLLPSDAWQRSGTIDSWFSYPFCSSEDLAMKHIQTLPESNPLRFDLDSLLHPAVAFEDPKDVVRDCDLTLNEKRAILASWASDACAVDSAPALRSVPGSGKTVDVDDILEALRTLDRQANVANVSWTRRQMRRVAIENLREKFNRPGSGMGYGLPAEVRTPIATPLREKHS